MIMRVAAFNNDIKILAWKKSFYLVETFMVPGLMGVFANVFVNNNINLYPGTQDSFQFFV